MDESLVRVVLRPLANPLPLGFLALAGATLLLSGLQLAWLPGGEGTAVALVLLAFAFPTQLVASILGYLARDVVAGTGMGVLAGTWLAVALVILTSPPGATSRALALHLWLAGAAMLVPAAGAVTGKLVPAAVLATTALRFLVTGGYEWTGADGWRVAAGVVGLVLCALAVYAALAMVIEDVRRRPVLPLWRRGRGRGAVTGDLRAQLQAIAHEAGVRDQLWPVAAGQGRAGRPAARSAQTPCRPVCSDSLPCHLLQPADPLLHRRVGGEQRGQPLAPERVGDHEVGAGGEVPLGRQRHLPGTRVDLTERAGERQRVPGEPRPGLVGVVLAAAADRHLDDPRGQRTEEQHQQRGEDVVAAAEEEREVRQHRDDPGERRSHRGDQDVAVVDV